jgi:DNA polymerase-3 subunit gamma/tau
VEVIDNHNAATVNTVAPQVSASVSKPVSAPAANGVKASPFNLSALREKVKTQVAVQKEEKSDEPEVYVKADGEKFKAAWKGYIQNLQERNKTNLYHSATKTEPEITEEGSVKIVVGNQILKNLFLEDKLNLNDFLNTNYGIHSVKIEFDVQEATEEEMRKYMVSDTDKFRRMVELNPAVLDLSKRLGLMIQ